MSRLSYCLLSLGLLLTVVSAQAQSQQTSYQVFQLDSLSEIELDLYDAYRIERWAANKLMAESTIKLYNCAPSVLEHLLEIERYAINVDSLDNRLRLVSADQDRKKIKTSAGECFEVIELTLYIPEDFEEKTTGFFARKPEESTDDQ